MTFLMNMIQNLIQASKKSEQTEPYYEVLDYIQLDGTQIFNLGFKSTLDTSYEIGVQFDDLTASIGYGICGSRDNNSASQNNVGTFLGTSTSLVVDFTNSDYSTCRYTAAKTNLSTSNWYDIYNNKTSRGMKLNGANVGTPNTTACTDTFTTTNDFYLGGYNGFTTSAFVNGFKGKIKYFKCNNPEMDMIPVLDSQMRPCFYDRISKQFYYHTNLTGTTTPKYQRWNKFDVDYIENTGTAYIPLTDLIPTNTMGMNIEYAYTVLGTSRPAGVIGTYNGDTQRKDTFFVSTSSGYTQVASGSNGVMVFHRGGNVGTSSATSTTYVEPEKDVWYTATVNWLGDGKINWTNGTDELEADVGANEVKTNELRLFSRCNSSNNTYNNCEARVRKLQFSDGINIIRNYKPVVWHNSSTTAIATLYDEVYNKMMTPNGSLKAYIAPERTAYTLADGVQNDDYYLAENGTKTVSADHTSCYSNAFPVKQGDIVEWTVTAEATNANKRIHGYTTNADIEAGTAGSWVSMLAKIVFSTTSATTQTARFTVPSGINYIRVSHANVRESECKITITTTYEVGSNCLGTPDTELGTSNCFDTGIYGNQDMQVKLISYLPTNVQVTGQLFGSYDGSETTSKNYTINTTHTSGTAAPIRFNGKVITTPIKKGNTKVTIVDNKLGIWVDDALHGSWGNPNDFTTTTTLLILKCNNSSNVRQNGCCYCLIEENQTPIAEYIPVKNATVTTEYGLYDRVNGTLNTGVGTITFNALS